MDARKRRPGLLLLAVLLVAGLLASGPAHAALHADEPGPSCDACASPTAPPPSGSGALAPVQVSIAPPAVEADDVHAPAPRTERAPRGPPRA